MDEPKLNRFAVIGNPVAHSLSPLIHKHFAQQFDLKLSYEKIQAAPENFKAVVERFFAEGGRGLNITTPFKSAAADLAESASLVVKKSHSANTLFLLDANLSNNHLRAESTDGIGWSVDIKRLNIKLKGARVLVIGAGGAASVLIEQLKSESVAHIHVANRTLSRAQAFEQEGLTVSDLESIPLLEFDLIINTLSVGWQGQYPELNILFNQQQGISPKAYDLNYGDGAQPFIDWFVAAGGDAGQVYDGWGMLVEQAAMSFYLWWGKKPETKQLIQQGPEFITDHQGTAA